MVATVNHWKVGLFVLLVLGAVIVAVVAIGKHTTHRPTVAFCTYFDESVGGMDTGSLITFRGVAVGTVSSIAIADDHRHVSVKYEIDTDLLSKMGISASKQDHVAVYRIPPELRAQLTGNVLTGARNLSLDLFDARENPPPALPFAIGSNYIPAATTPLRTLEDSLAQAADKLPKLLDAVADAAGHVEQMVARLERDGAPGKAIAVLDHASAVLDGVDAALRRLDREGVPQKTSKTLDEVHSTLGKVDHLLDQLDGERGVVASVRRATDTLGQVGRGASSSMRDVDQTMDELRDALEAVRTLAEDLHRDPDALIKGRSARSSR